MPQDFNPQDMQSLYAAYNLYSNWDRMSAGQKSKAIVALGMQGYKFTSGHDFAKEYIVDPAKHGGEGLTYGQAFNLFSQGYNVYALAKNWKDLNNVQRVIRGTQFAANVAQTAKSFNLLGYGSQGAAVQGVSAASLSQAGWSAASNYGVGAVTAPVGTSIPAGYTAVASGGEGVIAAPTANAASTSYLQTVGGAAAVAAGAYQVYQGWGQGGARGRANGAVGGASMAGGLYAMGATNPYLLAAVVAISVVSNSVKTGKHQDQKERDGVLGFLKKGGYVPDNNQLTLPDGTIIDLGIDGHGNLHTAANADKLTDKHKKEGRGGAEKLNWWDTDYTNDLDFFAGAAGTTLSELLTGGKAKPISHLGGKIGNGALQNIGYGEDFTPENYGKLQTNMRSLYSQMGIKSKADGFQLANQMFSEGRISEADVVRMHQTLNFVFDDNNYDQARNLYGEGRFRGIEVAVEDDGQEPDTTVSVTPGQSIDPGRLPGSAVKPGAKLPSGKNTFDNPPPEFAPKDTLMQPIWTKDEALKASNAQWTGTSKPMPPTVPYNAGIGLASKATPPLATRTKDEMRAANRLLYTPSQSGAEA